MERQYKIYLSLVLFCGVGLFLLKVFAMVIIDPLQIFHKPWLRDISYAPQMRFQAAGIINNTDFDSIIVGSSMAQSFSPKQASTKFGTNFVNLSMSGSLLSERSIIIKAALKKPLKNIIMSLDGFAPVGEYKENFPVKSFDYLYNNKRLDDIEIYLNNEFIKHTVCNIAFVYPYIPSCKKVIKSLENVTEWSDLEESYKSFGGLKNWFYEKNNPQLRGALKKIIKSAKCIQAGCDANSKANNELILDFTKGRNSFDKYIVDIIIDHPETKFYLFFPPYTQLRYAIWQQENSKIFDAYVLLLKHIVTQAEKHNNLFIYGFGHLAFVKDIENYKDTGHYHPRFNTMILDWIVNDEYRLTSINIKSYTDLIRHEAKQYNVIAIGDEMNKYFHKVY